MVKLSACMIVKNEEDSLPRCLKSIVGLCDEIIIVDTGSTDKTVEIAEGVGAKVYHHLWEDNFSLHRNQAFGYATGEWYFVIDADEELIVTNTSPEVFRQRLDLIPDKVTSLAVTVNEYSNGTHTSWLGARFFRSSANPKYKYAVHNKIDCSGQAAGTDIELIHYGYHLSSEKMKVKRERTKRLLLKRIEKDVNDANAYYYLCQMAQGDGGWQEAVEHGHRCMELLPFNNGDEMQFYATLYFWMANAYMRLDDAGNAIVWIEKGLEFFPNDVDLNYLMVVFGYRTADNAIVENHSKIYFDAVSDAKERRNLRPDSFVNILRREDFVTRTIFCLGERHEKSIRNIIEKSKESAIAV